MNAYKKVISYSRILLPFIFAVSNVSLVFSQNSDGKQKDSLKVNTEVVKSEYCSKQQTYFSVPNVKVKDNHSEKTVELRLRLKLTITNTYTKPIIFNTSSFQIISRVISESSNGKIAEKSISKVFYNIIPYLKKFDSPIPLEPLFITINPKDTYTREIEDSVYFSDENFKKIMPGGDIRYQFLSWNSPSDFGLELRERWKNFGVLWIDPILTDSISIKIDQPLIECRQ